MSMSDRPIRQCPDCGVYTSNADHTCVPYDPNYPCQTPGCGAPTVFVFISPPGVGQGRSCKNGHYHGTNRELTIEEVI
jgi:hypothetical protein